MKRAFMDGYKTYDPETEGYGNSNQWKESFYERISDEDAIRIVDKESPYQILGISEGASFEEIKSAFRTKITEWHPDKNQCFEAEEMSKKIIAAYTILKKNKNNKDEDYNTERL